MRLGDLIKKHQVWFVAALAAGVVGATILLSVPDATHASPELAAATSSAREAPLPALGLPVGGLAMLILLIGSRILRHARRQETRHAGPAALGERG